VFDRNAGVAGAVATGFVTNTRHTLGESLIFKSEFATENNIANTMLVLGLQNEVTWQQNGFRREAIIVDNGAVYKQQITDNQETRTQLFTLSANTTYVVEIETQDGLVTTYVYAKGADRSSGVSFSAASSSVSFGSSYWFATGLYMPGVSGGSIYLDNVSATTRQRAQSQTSQYDSAGRLIKTIDGLGNATSYAYDAAGRPRRSQHAV